MMFSKSGSSWIDTVFLVVKKMDLKVLFLETHYRIFPDEKNR